jgi:hypothetical protein
MFHLVIVDNRGKTISSHESYTREGLCFWMWTGEIPPKEGLELLKRADEKRGEIAMWDSPVRLPFFAPKKHVSVWRDE